MPRVLSCRSSLLRWSCSDFIIPIGAPTPTATVNLTTPKLNETQIAENMIDDNFSSDNMVALVVPAGDYEKEASILSELEAYDEIDHTMGLVNVEAMDGYMLADALTPRQFAEVAGLDYEAAQVVYAAYAAKQEDYGKLAGNLASYKVPLIDMFLFVCDEVDDGVMTLDADQTKTLSDAATQMRSAKAQLCGTDYDRMLLYLTLPVGGDETYAFTDTIRDLAKRYYPDGDVYVAGDSTNEYDFEKSFSRDNMVVSIVSILIVLVVLLFTFNSVGMPILLIMVIQGSISDQLCDPDAFESASVFHELSCRQLHSDGREHRLRHRYRQPLSGAEKHDGS